MSLKTSVFHIETCDEYLSNSFDTIKRFKVYKNKEIFSLHSVPFRAYVKYFLHIHYFPISG